MHWTSIPGDHNFSFFLSNYFSHFVNLEFVFFFFLFVTLSNTVTLFSFSVIPTVFTDILCSVICSVYCIHSTMIWIEYEQKNKMFKYMHVFQPIYDSIFSLLIYYRDIQIKYKRELNFWNNKKKTGKRKTTLNRANGEAKKDARNRCDFHYFFFQ